MAVYICGIEIPHSKIRSINNPQLTMLYSKARKLQDILRIEFNSPMHVVSYLKFNGNIAHAGGNKNMLDLWVHHRKFLNGTIFNCPEIITYILETYGVIHPHELIAGLSPPQLLPKKRKPSLLNMSFDMNDYRIHTDYPELLPYFTEFKFNNIAYIPLRPEFISGDKYTYPVFGDPDLRPVKNADDLKSGTRNIRVVGHFKIPNTVPPEDLNTWRLGIFHLGNMFEDYDHEIYIRDWNVEHLTNIDYAFRGKKLHPSISTLYFYNCVSAEGAFDDTILPHFYYLKKN